MRRIFKIIINIILILLVAWLLGDLFQRLRLRDRDVVVQEHRQVRATVPLGAESLQVAGEQVQPGGQRVTHSPGEHVDHPGARHPYQPGCRRGRSRHPFS